MKKNSILKKEETVIRVLEVKDKDVLIIDCIRLDMPKWVKTDDIKGYEEITLNELSALSGIAPIDMKELGRKEKKFVHEHFTMIAGILPFIGSKNERSHIINMIAENKNVSKQTIRYYLCLYLAYQDASVFTPKTRTKERELTPDEKIIRWSLNKFYYTQKKHSLQTAYTMMLKEKYCDDEGNLIEKYPSFYQFRYFYRTHKNLQNFYISRNGIKDYQKNYRPLTGEGVQQFAPHVGVGMLDATICDIYLVNHSGEVIGRPILTACVDGFSGLCCGYMLSIEGGVYSLRGLLKNIITDKKSWCLKYGIVIDEKDWDCNELPGTLLTDKGSEYKSFNFEQVTELGVTLINLASYRPEQKGSVEKFFDLIQNSFKPYLKGKGVIEPDFMERGAHDYRKDASLTMEKFEKIILHCILYYNRDRIIENYPFTKEMISKNIKPHASDIWNYGKEQIGADLIPVTEEELILTLLPRTNAKFTRFGLRVNGLRYKNDDYTEMYLQGKETRVAYNPDDISYVWLLENASFVKFDLIESRFKGSSLEEVENIKNTKKQMINDRKKDNLQAKINLAERIQAIAENSSSNENNSLKGIRDNRKKELNKLHKNFMEGVGEDD